MTKNTIHDLYDRLKKKYPALPKYSDINHEFEVSTIDYPEFLLREIRRKIGDKFSIYMERLAAIVQPQAMSLSEFYEFACFTADEKIEIFNLFKQLKFHYRAFMILDLINDNKKEAEGIRDAFKFWMSFKKKLIPHFKQLEGCWVKKFKKKEILKYLG